MQSLLPIIRTAACLLAVTAGAASAEIVDQDGYLTDTVTSLDWLHVTATRDMTFNEVTAEFEPGGSLEGWRHASGDEFNELMNNMAVPYTTAACAPKYCEKYGDTEPGEVTSAIIRLGDTYDAWADETEYSLDVAPGSAGFTAGMLGDRNGSKVESALILDSDRVYRHSGEPAQPPNDDAEDRVYTHCVASSQACFAFGEMFPWERHDRMGHFLVRETSYVPPEICDNGIDDDGDGLVDLDDPDCAPPIGLQVRCMHSPIYPQAGEEVVITAEGIDANGDPVHSDTLEIYIGNNVTPFRTGGSVAGLIANYTPPGGDFSYGCRAIEGAETAASWRPPGPKLRSVDVGGANNPDWEAQPVFYNGRISEKIDIVFFHDDDEYTSYVQPQFLQDVHDLINDGLWSIPWFVEHQWLFNFWIARADGADASPEPGPPPAGQSVPSCNRRNTSAVRNIFNTKYKFRDAGAIVHTSNCRDNAGENRTFTIQAGSSVVLAHEMGHRPFGMADEYCRQVQGATICDGGHSQNNPFSNIYRSENGCRDSAAERPYAPDDCRLLIDANNGSTWWLGEPNYRNLSSQNQPRDLMQQSGTRENPTGSGPRIPAYAVGLTEIGRMNWFVQQCLDGRC